MGWVKLLVPLDDARFGKMFPCHGCEEWIAGNRRRRTFEVQRRRIARYSGTHPQQTFGAFDHGRVTPLIRRAYLGALAYAEDPKGWLVLHGSCGTGKSHLAGAIANRCPDQLVMSLIVPDLLDLLKSGFKNGDHDELLALCRTVDLLILDDMGTENPTPWAYEKLFQIINHRYNRQLPTVFVLNGRIEDLEPRIASRMSDRSLSAIYPMWGDDYRLKKARS